MSSSAATAVRALAAVPCGLDSVARSLEDAALELAHRELIVHDDEDLRCEARFTRDRLGCKPGLALAGTSERRGVEQQSNPAVAEDRRAEIAGRRREQRAERFDDDLVLAEQAIARRRDSPAARVDDDRRRACGQRRCGRADQVGEIGELHGSAAELQGRPSLERERILDADRFLDACERQAEHIAAALDEEHLEQGERERKHEDDLCAAAGLASHLERSPEPLDVSLDGIEADTAARKLGHLGRRRESGPGEHCGQRT